MPLGPTGKISRRLLKEAVAAREPVNFALAPGSRLTGNVKI
jgi:hypothetical protein